MDAPTATALTAAPTAPTPTAPTLTAPTAPVASEFRDTSLYTYSDILTKEAGTSRIKLGEGIILPGSSYKALKKGKKALSNTLCNEQDTWIRIALQERGYSIIVETSVKLESPVEVAKLVCERVGASYMNVGDVVSVYVQKNKNGFMKYTL